MIELPTYDLRSVHPRKSSTAIRALPRDLRYQIDLGYEEDAVLFELPDNLRDEFKAKECLGYLYLVEVTLLPNKTTAYLVTLNERAKNKGNNFGKVFETLQEALDWGFTLAQDREFWFLSEVI